MRQQIFERPSLMGYAPYLGQVRLRTQLSQEEIPKISLEELKIIFHNNKEMLRARPDCDPSGIIRAVLARQEAWINSNPQVGMKFMTSPEEDAALAAANECMQQPGPQTTTGPATAPVTGQILTQPPSEGVPTWAYVAGGLAAVGLVALLAS